MFHRLQPVLPPCFLEEQYRMHHDIVQFPSQIFYQGRLKTASTVIERPPLNSSLFSKGPVVFIDVHSGEQRSGKSFINKTEASIAREVITHLIEEGVSPLEIGVLTPYVGQARCIADKLAVVVKGVEVCSIDGFQGREKDVIIFSTVRCNSANSLGFLDNKYRINVLLTRAKRGILGIGCKKTLSQGSDIWRQWLEQAHALDRDSIKKDPSSHGARGTRGQHRKDYKERSYDKACKHNIVIKAGQKRNDSRKQ